MLDPDVDFAALYDARYYSGLGADPLVDYSYEFTHLERTVRSYEWTGIARIARRLVPVGAGTRWVDFGSGLGGLVSYLRGLGVDAYGFDHGFGAETAAAAGVPMLDEGSLKRMEGTVDVVSAIEVLEHLVEPQPALTQIARLLRPGGAFVYTTGNARRVKDLARWPYVIPEVHITFYTPETMTTLLRQSGLDPVWLRYGDGFDMLIRYKVLKNLRVKDRSPLQDLIPWTPIGAVLNRTHGITEMPFGRKR